MAHMVTMNEPLQKQVLRKRLRSKGIRLETVDLDALFDPALTLPENIANIESSIQRQDRRKTRSGADAGRRKFAQREARRRHERRPDWNERIDESKQASTVFADPTERQFKMWSRNPNKYDIEGVDTRKPKGERQQAKNPALVRRRGRRILADRLDVAFERRDEAQQMMKRDDPMAKRAGRTLLADVEADMNRIGRKMEKLDVADPAELVTFDMDKVI